MKFDPKELEVKYYKPGPPNVPPMPVLNTPITPRENYLRMLHHEQPLWMPTSMDYAITSPTCSPDAWAHGVVFGPGLDPSKEGGKDMLGVEWEIYGPGAMVRQGNPLVKDLDHWEDYVTFPDVESWDWEKSAKEVQRARDEGQIIRMAQFSGFFERLISLVDMEEALVSMIDEDCAPAIHRLFDYMCDLYDQHFEKYAEYLHADTVWFMDDWGTQRAPFFSIDTIREMLLPYLKRVVASAHKYGLIFDFHSDGKINEIVPLIVESGADSWEGQVMNDKLKVLTDYPDQLVCNVHMPPIPKDASEEEMRAIVDEFFDTYGNYRIVVDGFGLSPDVLVYLYEKSRRAYCG